MKRFIIDVEDEFQENAVFFGDEFICFEDDSESLVEKLNELSEENRKLKTQLKQVRKPLTDNEIRRLYSQLQEREYMKHCNNFKNVTISSKHINNKVRF